MLRQHGEVFRTGLAVADAGLVCGAWLAAYALRFHAGFEAPRGVPELAPYLAAMAVIAPLWLLLLRGRGLYEPQRTGSLVREVFAVAHASTLGVLTLVALTFFVRSYFFSRGVFLIFWPLSVVSVASFRILGRLGLRALRRRGYNLRHVVVAGAGRLAEEVIERIHAHPETGLRVRGVLAASEALRGRRVAGVPVVAAYGGLKDYLAQEEVDQVILALPREENDWLEKLLSALDDELATVRLVPDLLHVLTLRSSVEDLEGLPMINLRESPLVGWAAIAKRGIDLVVSFGAGVLGAPLLLGIAAMVWLGSGRPVLYGQLRTGLDGRVFRMWKFRTMGTDAERASGPVWTRRNDARRTRIGSWLRRTSLDELPQLWNVLRGDMSLVGPRPERPVFIEEFRREIPGYMLRHKVKAGVTGWAQVRGWRGDTSLHERIEHDIYYIQNWSLILDLRILLMTVWRGFVQRNAY